MLIDLDHNGGGILIEGDPDELLSLADDLGLAADTGEVESSLVNLDGVTRLTVRRTTPDA